jgi:hypothetical protein
MPEGISGTPAYLVPKVWRGEPHTRRTDVYAFGALLYELCSGRTPFGVLALPDLARAVLEREPEPLPCGSDASEARIQAIVGRCLRRDPAERFASGDELREALEELQREGAGAIVVRGNPCRGLRAFQADHRALFFGRATEIDVAVDRLRSDALLLVTGHSGVGKSSLCRAGILPGVRDGLLRDARAWTVVTTVPGRQPLGSVCAAVADLLDANASSLATAVRDDPAALARALRRRVVKREGVLPFVDQLEELITIADPAEALIADAALAEGAPGLRFDGRAHLSPVRRRWQRPSQTPNLRGKETHIMSGSSQANRGHDREEATQADLHRRRQLRDEEPAWRRKRSGFATGRSGRVRRSRREGLGHGVISRSTRRSRA